MTTVRVKQRAAPDEPDHTERFRMIAEGRVDLWVNILAAAVVAAAVGRLYPTWVAPLWLAAFCLVTLGRFALRRHYRERAPDAARVRLWGVRFTLSAAASGCLWGLVGSVILVTNDPIYNVFILFALGGMLSVGLVNNAAYTPAMFAFMVPAALPTVGALLSRQHGMQVEMAMMLAAFVLVLGLTGRNIGNSFVENFRVVVERRSLSIKLALSELEMAETQSIAQVGSWRFDPRSHLSIWSTELFHILGLDPRTTIPSPDAMRARIHPDDRAAARRNEEQWALAGSDRGWDGRLVMGDGAVKWVHELARTSRDAAGRTLRVAGILQDITERRMAQDKLDVGTTVLETLMEVSPEGVLVVDAAGIIIAHNRRFSEITGIPPAELEGGRDSAILANTSSSVRFPANFAEQLAYLAEHPEGNLREDLETLDGHFLDFYTEPLRPPTGDMLGRVWFLLDISERKRTEALALRMARFDPLTGLANRGVFVDALAHGIAEAKRGGPGFAVLYMDLDHFKDVNDTLGHPVGDELLKAVAVRLRSLTRASDTLSRFGGDEFALIATDVARPEDVAGMAQGLIEAMAEPFAVQGNVIYTGASVGIDIYGPGATDAETLLSNADEALYRAKAAGRSVYRFFTAAMQAEMRMRVALSAELRIAIDSGQLFLLYQPQVELETGRVTGLEAVIRWRHPSRGVLGSEVFGPVADQTGLAAKLGRWELRAACAQAKAWLDAGVEPLRMCVDVSATQFKSPLSLGLDIEMILAETGLPARQLELELTETVLMDVAQRNSEVLARLREAGLTIAIDKFGTGYSSLDYLRRNPVNRIKIAEAFVQHLETSPGDASIVKATISLAHDLGIKVIAEGVRRAAQLDLLRDWGCGEVAGYFFPGPLTAEDVTRLLRDGGKAPVAIAEAVAAGLDSPPAT